MPIRPLLLFFLPLLVAACAKEPTPVRLDLIGTAALTSGSRTVPAGDTLTTRAYAVGTEDAPLTHLRVTVTYEPTRTPFLYPTPLSSFQLGDVPSDSVLTYVDSVLAVATPPDARFNGKELLFTNRFSARNTSGTELWQYTISDGLGQTASRALRLTVRKIDSLAVFQSYTAVLRPVPPGAGPATPATFQLRDQARAYLNLRTGLVLPKYALLNLQNTLQANQPLVDLICVATPNALSLDAPDAASVAPRLNLSRWPSRTRRRTALRLTPLTEADFGNARTAGSFATAFRDGNALAADSLSTGTLAKNAVWAFRTAEGLNGLLLVSDLIIGASPVLKCSIKVEKR